MFAITSLTRPCGFETTSQDEKQEIKCYGLVVYRNLHCIYGYRNEQLYNYCNLHCIHCCYQHLRHKAVILNLLPSREIIREVPPFDQMLHSSLTLPV